jgi:glycosyltransferase involved in cell wall biosynthesis
MFLPHLHLADSLFMFNPYGLDVELLKKYKVAMVQRLSSQGNYGALKLFKKLGMKIVYDLDDDLWSVPTYNPAFHIIRAWLPAFEICASFADMITVSTEHLRIAVRRALGKKCPRVEVVENAIDLDWFKPVEEPLRRKKNGRVLMGWAGTNTHTGDVKRVFALLPALLRELPQLDFEVCGLQAPKEWIEEFGTRIRQRDFVPIAEFSVNWASWQWDIALAPLEDNRFNRSKSSIKLLEASAVKIPCVASEVGEYWKFASYSKFLKQNILCAGEQAWLRNIRNLVTDEALRKAVGEEMYRVSLENFDVRVRLRTWERLFQEVADG